MTAIAFSVAKPFRKQIYTNKPFLVSIVIILVLDLYLMFISNPNTDF
jgi:magnesium-transporting ATPase (P-type)